MREVVSYEKVMSWNKNDNVDNDLNVILSGDLSFGYNPVENVQKYKGIIAFSHSNSRQ
jgi:hypothetical protein